MYASIDRILLLLLCLQPLKGQAQTDAHQPPSGILVDRVIANVAGRIVLYSELAGRLTQARQAGETVDDAFACGELEDMLFQQLLLDQARIDSVFPDEAQVNGELDRRIAYFERQIGGMEQLEKFYGKSIAQIKAEFREQVADQMLVQQMQQKVIGDIRVTPKEVERFFKAIPKDSLPFINASVEFARVLRYAHPSEAEDRRVRQQLEEYRTAIVNGSKDFCTMAVLYSADEGSAARCGELGMVPLGTMVPEFDAVAMSLKESEISPVFRTAYGYHVMQMIERKGERYNARHILLSPAVSQGDLVRTRATLDSLVAQVRDGKLDFSELATRYNDDEETKGTNGAAIEPNSNGLSWSMGELSQQDFVVLDKLVVGQISEAMPFEEHGGKKGFRVLRLNKRTEPHVMDLVQDYPMVVQAAEGQLRQKAIMEWAGEKITNTWIRIIPDYAGCTFQHHWVQ